MNFNHVLDSSKYRLGDFQKFKQLGLIPVSGDFYPVGVHYPPITMYPDVSQEDFFKSYEADQVGVYDIYVHIPFCKKKCYFCHYPSKYSASDSVKDEYLNALEKEIDIYRKVLKADKIKARTILVGGGTPTDLSPAQLRKFLDFFSGKIDITGCTQYNFDVDPITLVGEAGNERLKIMRDYGVDRLTIGVQSFDNDILKRMNRSHDSSVAYASIENSKKYDYQINIEFIFGHPGQTLKNWYSVLQTAVSADVPEIQFYRLKVIPYGDQVGTVTRDAIPENNVFVSNEEAILMKEMAIQYLEGFGYTENLRRVFTKGKKYISRYAFNQCCQLKEEIGCGLTAFSSLNDRFALNTQTFKDYYKRIERNLLPINRGLIRDDDQQARWAVILPLKNYWISKKIFAERTGSSIDEVFVDKFKKLKEYKLIEEENNKIKLTKTGAFFADEVAAQFEGRKFLPFSSRDYVEGVFNPYI